jgi:hypothetical protein
MMLALDLHGKKVLSLFHNTEKGISALICADSTFNAIAKTHISQYGGKSSLNNQILVIQLFQGTSKSSIEFLQIPSIPFI